jgi:hypothetical protein
MILTRAFWTHAGSSRLMAVCTGTVDKIYLININRPLRCIRLPFQEGSLSATQSTRGCQANFGSLDTERGRPRYLMGNSTMAQGKKLVARLTCASSHRMGAIWHLPRLHRRPNAPANTSRMPPVIFKLEAAGEMNMMRSSAYKETRCLIWRTPIAWSTLHSSALQKIALRTSMTRINRRGDRGSPWRRPHAWQMR